MSQTSQPIQVQVHDIEYYKKRLFELRSGQPEGDPFELDFGPLWTPEQGGEPEDIKDFEKVERGTRIVAALQSQYSTPTTIEVSPSAAREIVLVSGIQSVMPRSKIWIDDMHASQNMRSLIPVSDRVDLGLFARPHPVVYPIGLVSSLTPFLMTFTTDFPEQKPWVIFALYGRTPEQIERFGLPPGY